MTAKKTLKVLGGLCWLSLFFCPSKALGQSNPGQFFDFITRLLNSLSLPSPSASSTPFTFATPTPSASPPINAGTRDGHPPAAVMPTPTLSGFGGIIQGASADEMTAFAIGKAQFEKIDLPADGLGPIFNGQSCQSCHVQPDVNGMPITGGAGPVTETRFESGDGTFDLLHQACITQDVQDQVPFDAVLIAHRRTTSLFGAGLIEAISDATIIAQANQPQADGVHGRAAMLFDPVTLTIANTFLFNAPANTIGRFGWKAQIATLLGFASDAYLNEIGVTNRFAGTDNAPHLRGTQPKDTQALADAEPAGITPTTLQDTPTDPTMPESQANQDDIDRFTTFMQLLNPPPTVPLTAQAQQGQQVFRTINCVACHLPQYMTGPSKISQTLAFKPVPLYSDLLLHDMGSLADGIAQGAAGQNELRTAPLWGIRARTPFLHDGRAATIPDAILAHDGEAKIIHDRYNALSQTDKDALLAFLLSI